MNDDACEWARTTVRAGMVTQTVPRPKRAQKSGIQMSAGPCTSERGQKRTSYGCRRIDALPEASMKGSGQVRGPVQMSDGQYE